ncbi:MAG: MBL fold metallo-hydrolase [Halopenitus sp.]
MRRFSIPVDTRAPTGATNAYLLGDRDPAGGPDSEKLLVDPASPQEDLETAVESHGVDHVAVTHTHPDHVGAVDHYAGNQSGEATVWAHANFVEEFRTATGVEPDRTFADGDQIGPATVVATPGHARDHVAFAFADESGRERLLVGDLAVAEGSVVVGGAGADLIDYLDSLRRVRERDPHRLHPGHGPTIDDPVATIDRLIDHRLDREEKVLAAVDDGATDVDGVVDAAYDKDLTGVEDLARATTVAHLEKLLADGRIDDSWREHL